MRWLILTREGSYNCLRVSNFLQCYYAAVETCSCIASFSLLYLLIYSLHMTPAEWDQSELREEPFLPSRERFCDWTKTEVGLGFWFQVHQMLPSSRGVSCSLLTPDFSAPFWPGKVFWGAPLTSVRLSEFASASLFPVATVTIVFQNRLIYICRSAG